MTQSTGGALLASSGASTQGYSGNVEIHHLLPQPEYRPAESLSAPNQSNRRIWRCSALDRCCRSASSGDISITVGSSAAGVGGSVSIAGGHSSSATGGGVTMTSGSSGAGSGGSVARGRRLAAHRAVLLTSQAALHRRAKWGIRMSTGSSASASSGDIVLSVGEGGLRSGDVIIAAGGKVIQEVAYLSGRNQEWRSGSGVSEQVKAQENRTQVQFL